MIGRRLSQIRAYLAGEGLGPLLVRALAGSAVVRVAAMVASFVVGVQLARILGVEGYGYYGLALSIITLANIPAELGISRLVTREVAASSAGGDIGQMSGVLRWAFRTSGLISLLVMVALAAAGIVLMQAKPALGGCLLAGAPLVLFMTLARVSGGALQGVNRIVRGQIPANLIRPVLLSLFLLLAYMVRVAVLPVAAMALNSLAAAAVFVIAFSWQMRHVPRARPSEAIAGKSWIKSSIALAMTQAVFLLQSELSILLVGVVASPSAVGLLRIAIASANVSAASNAIVVHVGAPLLARLYAEADQRRLQKAVTALAWVQLAGVLVVCAPLAAWPGPLIRLVFGGDFAGAADALRILAIGQIVNAAFGPNGTLLNMARHERRVTRAMTFSLIVALVLVPLLTIAIGIAGAAIAMLASILTWNLILWRDAKRMIGIDTSAMTAPRLVMPSMQ